ncbi:FHA domain-containing protein, partial [bacterium]|nr:FHA domain-containing protein [bacterium]
MDLIIEQGGHTTPLKLADGIHLVGRAPQSSVRLTDPQVSGRHARLRVDGSRLFVSDLGSLNGTELDG